MNKMLFELTILGNSSATPTIHRHPTAQVFNCNEQLFLIDCGEGTQMQLLKYKIKIQRINHIFISHLHGDHFFGLMGLLSTLHLQGRSLPLHLYGPPALKDIIDLQFFHSETSLRYEIHFHPIDPSRSERILTLPELTVDTIILSHRIPCTGFLFREQMHPRKLIKEKLADLKVPIEAIPDLKAGKDVTIEGTKYSFEEITTSPDPQRSYAYCSDTIYTESFLNQIRDIDLMYHEATFTQDLLERAKETFHTTALQAGELAKKASVKKLIIGHFSARYKELDVLLNEARSVFSNTELALEGHKYSVL